MLCLSWLTLPNIIRRHFLPWQPNLTAWQYTATFIRCSAKCSLILLQPWKVFCQAKLDTTRYHEYNTNNLILNHNAFAGIVNHKLFCVLSYLNWHKCNNRNSSAKHILILLHVISMLTSNLFSALVLDLGS